MAGLGWLTYDDFSGLVGDRFDATTTGGDAVGLELVEATQGNRTGGRGPDGQERLQFSLVFRGPHASFLAQGTYVLSHRALGDLELFLVPIGADAEGLRYEAAFA